MKNSLSYLFLTLILSLSAGPRIAAGQNVGGPKPAAMENPADEPWLRINAGGHTGSVQALAFTPDGKRLCSAGLDKYVQVWNLAVATRDIRRAFLRERAIRWQVARGLRGSIYALASAASDGLLALGGYGAMGSLGEILLVSPIDGKLVQVLKAHRQTVCSLAFTPDGNWLASADVAGQIVLWKRGQWQPVTLYEPDDKTYGAETARLICSQPKFRPVAMAGNSHVVAPVFVGRQPDGRLAWQLQYVRLADTKDHRTLETKHYGMVAALAASVDGSRLASADLEGRLWLGDLQRTAPAEELQRKASVLALSFSPDGRTLVAGTAVVPPQNQSQLQVWDLATRTVKRSRSLPDHVRACQFSPDGKSVAYAGGKDNEVFVEPLDQPQRTVQLRGKGRRVFKVAFAREEPFYRVAWGTEPRDRGWNDLADLAETFDSLRLEMGAAPLKATDWLSPDWLHGDWTVRPQPGGLQLFEKGVPRSQIVLDPAFDGRPRCSCWIADAQGKPAAIAVGTDVQNSIYVYQLIPQGRCPVLRHFRGHNDFVTSVGVSRDQRYLVSGSADGTVMIWSLAEFQQGAAPLGRWGVDFVVQGAELVAKTVHPAGLLFARGVRPGDVLREIQWVEQGARRVEKTPAAVLQRLKAVAWNTQMAFQFARAGALRPLFQRLPAWEPLATLFVGTDREWAFWTPYGYYDASANGYTLFGWQVNRGLDVLPDFYRADQFRKRLERPDVMERLLPAGSLDEAMRQAVVKPSVELQAILSGQIAATPRIEILTPQAGDVVPQNVARVRARIVVPGGSRLVQAKVFANGVVAVRQQLVAQQKVESGQELTYDWDVPLPADPKGLIQLIAGTDAETVAFRDVLIERPAGPAGPAPKLHIIATGINTYADPAIQGLAFAVADAQAIVKALQERSKGLYSVGEVRILENKDATPKAWRRTVEDVRQKLKDQAKPDDLLVLYFAGHGVVAPGTQTYYFVGHDFKLEDLQKGVFPACISWNDFHLLSDVPCRKLVLLDTCHSGAIQPLRARNLKSAIRVLEEDLIFSFAASAGNERSEEKKSWGHGAFTKSLLEAMEGPHIGGSVENAVTLNEVVDYVEQSVAKLTEGRQNPVAAPSEVLPFTALRIARPGASQLPTRNTDIEIRNKSRIGNSHARNVAVGGSFSDLTLLRFDVNSFRISDLGFRVFSTDGNELPRR